MVFVRNFVIVIGVVEFRKGISVTVRGVYHDVFNKGSNSAPSGRIYHHLHIGKHKVRHGGNLPIESLNAICVGGNIAPQVADKSKQSNVYVGRVAGDFYVANRRSVARFAVDINWA